MTAKTPEDLSPREAKTELYGTPCCRAEEPGWILAAMHDPVQRRGLWYREHHTAVARDGTSLSLYKIEVCAGREGDDRHASLEVGQIITAETLHDLRDALESAAWMAKEAGVSDEDGRVVAWKIEDATADDATEPKDG